MLDIRERLKTKTTAVEVLTVMLVEAGEFCSSYANVKTLVARVSALMHEHSSKRTVTMPCLGVILAARDQNFDAVMKSAIQFVPPDHLAVLKEAARIHAPDLLDNLESSQFRFSIMRQNEAKQHAIASKDSCRRRPPAAATEVEQ